ncbi:MAG: hypothetical protein K2M95_01685 [Clostridiales bacterium]|nr:hypothetical protein [Clostridiales bacterium]
MAHGERKSGAVQSARSLAYAGAMTGVLLAAQFALSGVQGVEVVTVLFLTFCVACGVRLGLIVANAFSLIRCFLFGFFPNVVALYLIYYNLFAVVFGLLGRGTARLSVPARIALFTGVAVLMTALFTFLDDMITPLMLGYTKKSATAYFYASLLTMIVQCVCAAVTVAALWYPLSRAFSRLRVSKV